MQFEDDDDAGKLMQETMLLPATRLRPALPQNQTLRGLNLYKVGLHTVPIAFLYLRLFVIIMCVVLSAFCFAKQGVRRFPASFADISNAVSSRAG